MTKLIRIENADTSNHKVLVEVWEDVKDGIPTFVKSFELNSPTQMISEHIWGNRYITVREVK
jgi:hypothetical protein